MFVALLFISIGILLLYWQFFRKVPLLSKEIPGPSGLPIVGNLFQIIPKEAIAQLESWAFKFGPIYQIDLFGSPTIIISDLNEIQSILKQRPRQYRRGDQAAKVLNDLGLRGLFTLEGMEWKGSRNIIAPALSTSKVSQMKLCVLENALDLRTKLMEIARIQQGQVKEWFDDKRRPLIYRPSELISLQTPIQRCILNIVLETTLSYGNKKLFDENMFKDINHMFENINENFFFPLRSILGYKNANDRRAINTAKLLAKKVLTVIEASKRSLAENVDQTNEDGNKLKRTLLYSILENEHNLSEETLIGNIGQVIVAGYETTAVTLTWCLYYLAKYPTFQKKIQEEADRVLPAFYGKQPEELCYLDIDQLPTTHNFIKEVMRHRPVAPIVGLTSNETTCILGHTIPKGAHLILLSRLATLFETPTPKPLEFCPDRWNLDPSSELYREQSGGLLSFGAGPRICPGRHLALLEMVLITACVFSNFDISFFPSPPGHDEVHEISALTMKPENLNLLLQIRSKFE